MKIKINNKRKTFFNLFAILAAVVFLFPVLTGCISDNIKPSGNEPAASETAEITAGDNASTGNKNLQEDTAADIKETENVSGETAGSSKDDQIAASSDQDSPAAGSGETAGQNNPAESEGDEIKITPKAPEIVLQVISGPEYAQDNQVCFYRVRANVAGEPFPEIKFNKDDSNSAWGLNIAQVNLTRDESFTLVCEAVNSQGSASAEISLGWVENQSGQSGSETTAPDIVVDYTDAANFLIDVNLTLQQVTVLYKNVAIKSMACSGGTLQTPTPQGTYTTNQKIYYAWIPRFAMGAYYWTRFYGPYLFHSVPFDYNGNMMLEELAKIGSPDSHGCIRLVLEDAMWLYETLPLGIKVSIHN